MPPDSLSKILGNSAMYLRCWRAGLAAASFLCLTPTASAQASSDTNTALDRDGSLTWQGHNAPKDVVIGKPTSATGRYTMRGDSLIESGGGTLPDPVLHLCRGTDDT
jgi:hypothetical protein